MSTFMQLLDQKQSASTAANSSSSDNFDREAAKSSLVDLCRSVLVSNLEKYPTEALAILDEEEWGNVVKLRWEKSRPQKGKGGLDGKGRMTPAIGDRFMLEVEKTVPHLANSELVDDLVWKDIVEFRFKAGGVSRPRGLMYPWPVLESLAAEYRDSLQKITGMDNVDAESKEVGIEVIKEMRSIPMNVALLKSTEIGKVVKKFLKACATKESFEIFDEPISTVNLRESPRTLLEGVLNSWKTMAAKSGIPSKEEIDDSSAAAADCCEHLDVARKCSSWRELYAALVNHDEERRSNQGARMRERRQRLDSVRPKIVKVRHASSRQNALLDRKPSASLSVPNLKIRQLKMEASVTSMRRRPPVQATAARPLHPPAPVASGFGAAVAFASGQRGTKRKQGSSLRTKAISLDGNKRMRIPDNKKAASNMQRLAKKGGFSLR